jgi:hypothetical protein
MHGWGSSWAILMWPFVLYALWSRFLQRRSSEFGVMIELLLLHERILPKVLRDSKTFLCQLVFSGAALHHQAALHQ